MQIAKIVFLTMLEIMKKILDLGAFRLGKKTNEFIYFKKEVMNYFYEGMKKIFKNLEQNKIIEKCLCKSNYRQGYKDCPYCGGSGYRNRKNV